MPDEMSPSTARLPRFARNDIASQVILRRTPQANDVRIWWGGEEGMTLDSRLRGNDKRRRAGMAKRGAAMTKYDWE